MIPYYDQKINRKVRVFISSTFADMQTERNIIVHSVFPRLRKEFSSRLIDITEVDLRWGIPEDDDDNSRILEICIGEVLHCAPFFVGIVGGRYGSIASDDAVNHLPPAYRKALGEMLPSGLSITELEMRAGVFVPNNYEYSCFFVKENVRKDPALKPEVKRLLDNISGSYRTCTYEDDTSFEEALFSRLRDYIDKMIPDKPEIPYGDQNYYSHLKVLKSNNYRYVPDNYQIVQAKEKINRYRQVYLQGEKGTGKSAFLSCLIKEEGIDSDGCVFFHYAAAGSRSAHTDNAFHRLRLFLESEFHVTAAEEDDRSAVTEILRSGRIDRRTVLFFDAMDQLDDATAIYSFFALAEQCENICVVCSGTDEFPKIRGEQIVRIRPLSEDQISQIMNGMLNQYGKRLSGQMRPKIVRKKECANPLFLRALLFQLIVYGTHDSLEEFFEQLLKAENFMQLFDIMVSKLKRYFSDSGIDEKKVDLALALIVYSCNGVTENEMQEILDILPIAKSVFLTAVELFTIEDNGRIRFNHDLIVTAAKSILKKTNVDYERLAAEKLIAFFASQQDDWRKYSELTFQLCKLNKVDELKRMISDPDCFEYLFRREYDSCIGYLSHLVDRQAELAPVLTNGKTDEEKVKIAKILCLAGCHNAAIEILDAFENKDCTAAFRVSVLDILARSQYKLALNGFKTSIETYKTLIAFYREHFPKDEIGYASRAYLLGVAYKTAGDPARSVEILKECAEIFRNNEVRSATSIWAYDVYGESCYTAGKMNDAMVILNRAIDDCVYLFGRMSPELAWAYCYGWNVLYAAGDKANALQRVHEAYEIYDRLYHGRGSKLAWAASNEGSSFLIQGKMKEAEEMFLFSIKENDCIIPAQRRPHVYSLTAYANLACLYEKTRRHNEALSTVRFALKESARKNGVSHMYTANIRLLAGIVAEDAECIREAVASFLGQKIKTPDVFFARMCLARILAKQKQAEAAACIERCCQDYFSEERETDLITYLILDTAEKITGNLTDEMSDMLDELFRFEEYEYYLTHNNNSQLILIPKI